MPKARKTTTRKPRKHSHKSAPAADQSFCSRKPAPVPAEDPFFEFAKLEPCTRYDFKVTAIIVLGMSMIACLVAAVSLWF